jgi:hypothetical protein
MIRPGVMMAKVSWNITQIASEISALPAPVARGIDALQHGIVQVAKDAAGACKRKTITTQPPQNGDHSCDAHALRDDREYVLFADKAAIKEGETWQCHKKHQRSADHLPGIVASRKWRQIRSGCRS